MYQTKVKLIQEFDSNPVKTKDLALKFKIGKQYQTQRINNKQYNANISWEREKE